MPRVDKIMVFDTETTGTDVENDRIVTAFIGLMDSDGTMTEFHEWLIDPGIPIPEGASSIHGITTEKAQTEGRKDIAKALMEIATKLDYASRWNIPVDIYNAPYDLTILDRELRRHVGLKTFRPPNVVIDPFVIDKKLFKFRKGKRTLTTVAPHYGVPVEENAHDAQADCLMAGRIGLKQLEHEWIAPLTLQQLHERQIKNKADQSASLQAYFESKRLKDIAAGILPADAPPVEPVRPEWPMYPFEESTNA